MYNLSTTGSRWSTVSHRNREDNIIIVKFRNRPVQKCSRTFICRCHTPSGVLNAYAGKRRISSFLFSIISYTFKKIVYDVYD